MTVKTLQRWDISGKLPAKRITLDTKMYTQKVKTTVLRSNNAFIHQNKAKAEYKSRDDNEQARWNSSVYL
ncbi:MAG: hypothetical protein JGK17_24155 [Microcoleus sp. PH2017_10_PVI_O_A]|uniref:hypothetical protein n=1 Tax=unclassified Microcoleus TaxID=2642155 RepID=UPI001DC056EA|nr:MULTISPECIES: hypothetical protein [unclassified Microcoleus]TAE78877.1 MAG: hypothetical protein EAZ83_23450 [Oscillatoriales cyanobacterium]MCC3408615.1 hypothetical protein [Microcoleus sp. PH2017_10_PVI_O_A]MCC3462701.1 hypothetical protein [Microcoleus sp. PH2017_11_PCY_U_A]MCC3481153.1 hypothetical protein [Microcoleus sp. PH2017_12_PCY_D_A]MCC3530856.1 hypothetical protein [Microcoleus sp. PH2017_21_RUC_O_A]